MTSARFSCLTWGHWCCHLDWRRQYLIFKQHRSFFTFCGFGEQLRWAGSWQDPRHSCQIPAVDLKGKVDPSATFQKYVCCALMAFLNYIRWALLFLPLLLDSIIHPSAFRSNFLLDYVWFWLVRLNRVARRVWCQNRVLCIHNPSQTGGRYQKRRRYQRIAFCE